MEPKSYIIPDDIFEEVNAVTHELIRYENPNNLNWMPAYQDVLNQMGKGEQDNDKGRFTADPRTTPRAEARPYSVHERHY